MKATTILSSFQKQPQSVSSVGSISWYSYLLLFSTSSIVTGVIWDISWHMTIGRDTLFSPPHLAIYLGGILAGLSSLWKILHTSYWANNEVREQAVSFGGLKAPLGTLFCLWGAGAMITSAPFDDWWHNAYGLDVKILSPPHTLLALGIFCIQIGTVMNLLSLQNNNENASLNEKLKNRSRRAYTYSMGLMTVIIGIFVVEFTGRGNMHNPLFYQVICGVYPISIVSGNKASKLRWSATSIAAIYMGVMMLTLWILPLFSGSPKLAPIKHNVDHMVPMPFPLFMIIPAFVLDIVMRRIENSNLWKQAIIGGLAFFFVFLTCQWVFASFLMTPYARNWFFATHEWAFYRDLPIYRYSFMPFNGTPVQYILGFIYALIICIISCRIAIAWGNWMRRVQR